MPKLPKVAVVAVVIAAAGAVIVTGLLIAGNASYTSSSLARAVHSILVRTGAQAVSTGPVSITPLSGLRVDSVTASLVHPRGDTTVVRVGRVTVAYSPLGVLLKGGRLRAAAEAVLQEKGMAPLPKLERLLCALGDAGLLDVVHRVDGADIRLLHDSGAGGTLRAEGGRLSCVTSGGALRGHGTADSLVVHGRHAVTDVRMSLRLADSTLVVESLDGRYAGGVLDAHIAMRPRERMLDSMECDLVGIDAGVWHRTVTAGDGSLGGAVDVQLRLGRSPLILDSLAGTISLSSSDLTATETPLQKTLASLFGSDDMQRFAFTRVTVDMALAEGRLDVRHAEALGLPLSFATHGWVRYDGTLSQRLTGSLDRSTVEGLSPLVRHVLIRAPEGQRRFVCEVSGAFARPVVSLEKGMMKRAVERAIEELMIDD
ncbi:MAG: hypothetical protein GF331_16385 [Chitinivibrionales bacterium]|nr:hypothetical protein [Chitinivibrionales bacterium]